MKISKFGLLALAGVATASMATSLAAQTPAPQQRGQIDVPAQPLSSAVAALASKTGTSITIDDPALGRVMTSEVSGASSVSDALTRMLAGTGLSWHETASGYAVSGAVIGGDAATGHVLSAVRVEGTQASGGALAGFGAGAGANGSSDPTATEGTGSLTTVGTSVATKTPTTFKETPQTVVSVTSAQIRQQNITDLNTAIAAVPGLTSVSSNAGSAQRILSRGFEVTTYQVDGGAPLALGTAQQNTTSLPGLDLGQYDHVEVLRGSAGLFGGANSPGGVISLQRKRPLDHQQVTFDAIVGSYGAKRGQLDLSSPIAFDGHLRARVVGAIEDNDYFINYTHRNRYNIYGIVEADLGPDTVIRAGGSYDRVRDDMPDAGGVRLGNEGQDLHLPRSTNLTANYAYGKSNANEQFVQLDHRFGDDWTLNLNATRTHRDGNRLVPYVGLDVRPDLTALYVSNNYTYDRQNQFAASGSLAGKFDLFGHASTVVVGGDYTRSSIRQVINSISNPDFEDYVSLNPYNPNLTLFDPSNYTVALDSLNITKQVGAYINLAVEPLDGFHLAGGVRYVHYLNSSNLKQSYGDFSTTSVVKDKFPDHWSPTFSATYDLTKVFSLYASYADVLQPVSGSRTAGGDLLPPQTGRTIEGGVKATLNDGKLNASLAYFDTRQNNVPIYAGSAIINNGSCCFLPGGAIRSRGVDFTVSGALTDRWQVNGGYTYNITRYNDIYEQYLNGGTFPVSQSQQPKHQVKLWTAYTVPFDHKDLTLSAGFRLESARSVRGTTCTEFDDLGRCTDAPVPFAFTQGTYAVGDLRVAYAFEKHWEMAFSLTNFTDTRYYSRIDNPVNNTIYGDPRTFTMSLRAVY